MSCRKKYNIQVWVGPSMSAMQLYCVHICSACLSRTLKQPSAPEQHIKWPLYYSEVILNAFCKTFMLHRAITLSQPVLSCPIAHIVLQRSECKMADIKHIMLQRSESNVWLSVALVLHHIAVMTTLCPKRHAFPYVVHLFWPSHLLFGAQWI